MKSLVVVLRVSIW